MKTVLMVLVLASVALAKHKAWEPCGPYRTVATCKADRKLINRYLKHKPKGQAPVIRVAHGK